MVVEVLWTWGVAVRVLADEAFPPLRMVVPRSQLCALLDMFDVRAGARRWSKRCESVPARRTETRPLRAHDENGFA